MAIKRVLGTLTAAFLILSASSASLMAAQAPPGSQLRILSSGEKAIELELTIDDFQIEAVDYGGQTYHRLIIPDMTQTDTPGQPQVPTRGTLLGLPSPEGVSIQILDASFESLQGYRLCPAPTFEPTFDDLVGSLAGEVNPTFDVDRDLYASDAFYPGHVVELGHTGYLRDQAVAQVQFYPVQYNPATGELRLYRRIRAQVTWDAPPLSTALEGLQASPAYEHVLENVLVNYDALERPQTVTQTSPTKSISPTPYSLFPTPHLHTASASTDTLKIGVTEDGLYQLTHDDLTGAGIELNGVDPGTIKISNRGAEIPSYVYGEDDGTFGIDDTVLFYGTAITDIYTLENVYWLTVGSSDGQRMDTRAGTPASATVPPKFPATLHAEVDDYYWQTMPEGAGQDHWFWGERLTASASRPYTLTLRNISATASTATVRVRLKGRTKTDANPDHHTRVYLNGVQIDDRHWDGQIVYDHEVTVAHSLLNDGSNTITVESVGDTGATVDQIFINWIEIDYWDTYVAEDDQLLFGAPAAGTHRFEISGFTTGDAQVFDVTDPSDVAIITGTTILANGGSYTLQFEDTAQARTRYMALTPAQRQSPATLQPDQPSAWKNTTNGADYILITHEDFYTSSLRLASHRSITSGLRVATVKVGDVYDEFNYGIFNPQAIRDFLSYAYHNWTPPAPTYVVLVGDAYQDYKDNLNTGTVNYVPSQVIETDLLGETPSDNWFVLVNGPDILPDMFIGRLSAQQVSQVDAMVDKIIQYEQYPPDAPWNTQVLLVADDDETSFESTSEQLADRLPHYYTAHRVYANNYPPENPTTDISNSINGGNVLVNYTGHGSVDRWGTWSGGDIFVRSDIATLGNTHRLPVVTTANCLNGFFVGSQTQVSMAEGFLRFSAGGAVATWAPTSLGYPSGHRLLMREFYDAIFQDDLYALGTATTFAKIAAYNQNSSWAELIETFVLFGDPATSLGIPTNYPYVESTTPTDGTSDVDLDQDIQLVFSKPMSPTTVLLSGPGTAGLVFTPTWSAGNLVLNYAHTDFDYNQTLTLTIGGQDRLGNPLGSGPIPNTWSFTTPFAPSDVDINGPKIGRVHASYAFDATVKPSIAAQPITFTWQATNQVPRTHTGRGLLDTAIFSWSTPGAKTITVTTSNVAGTATQTHDVIIYVLPDNVAVTGPTTGAIDTVYTFDATVSPISVTLPLTYVWQATGQSPVTHTGRGSSDTASFDWDSPGTKSITVTASNGGGAVRDTYLTTIKAPPTSVEIAGRATGVVQVDYTFDAAVSPANATPPFTYTWEASGQPAVTHTDEGLSDAVTFNWDTPGTKTITVTVSNDVGTASSTAEVTLDYSPPTDVQITGPTKAAVDTAYTFSAAVGPITATRPITYVWQATGQAPVTHTGGGWDDAVTFTWNTIGFKSITVTVTNAGGSFTQSHQVAIWSSSVDLAGPRAGIVQADYVFTATVNPGTVPQPVTYVWEATGQPPLTHAGLGLTDSATYNWVTPGTKHIIVTATNATGTISNTYEVDITYSPPTRVQVTGPVTGTIDTACTFNAAVSPITATQPITYVWEATGQVPAAHTGRGLNDAVSFTWATTGTRAITVTAVNLGGTATEYWLVTIDEPSQRAVYLPLVIRND